MSIFSRKRKTIMTGDDIRIAGNANTYRYMTLKGEMITGNLSEISNTFYRECVGTCICHGVTNKVFNGSKIFNKSILALLNLGDVECNVL